MKSNQILVTCICIASITSCKKDKTDNITTATPQPTQDVADYFQLTPGNYWVYDTYMVDTSGNAILAFHDDTLARVGNDTIINGATYHSFSYEYLPGQPGDGGFVKDSGDYIVSNTGKIFFSLYNYTDTLRVDSILAFAPNIMYLSGMMKDKDSVITVPAGTFTTSNFAKSVWFSLNNPCSSPRYINTRYSKGTGLVSYTYFSTGDCLYHYETRLKSYYVQ